MTAWSHVIDLVGRMQAANERVNAAFEAVSCGGLTTEQCRTIRDGAAAEIETLNASLAALLADLRAQDTGHGPRRPLRRKMPNPALLKPGRALRFRRPRRFGARCALKTSA